MNRVLLFTVVLSGFLTFAAAAPGEEKPAGNPASQSFDIDFPGGSFSELLVAIEKRIKGKANVLASKEALNVVLPAFHFRGVCIKEVFDALESLGGVDGTRISVKSIGQIITIRAEKPRRRGTSVVIVTRVHDLRDLMGPYKIEDVVTAIETAWKMDPDDEPGKMKFHEETKCLIARGHESTIAVLEDVIAELRKGLVKSDEGAKARKAEDMLAMAVAQKEKSDAERDLANKRLEDAMNAQLRFAQQTESYERQVTDLRARLRELTAETNALRQKLKDLEEYRAKKKSR